MRKFTHKVPAKVKTKKELERILESRDESPDKYKNMSKLPNE